MARPHFLELIMAYKKGPSRLAKFSMGLAKAGRKAATAAKMAYHGAGYQAAKTGKKYETPRTKAIKRVVKSSSGFDWEKDKPTARRK